MCVCVCVGSTNICLVTTDRLLQIHISNPHTLTHTHTQQKKTKEIVGICCHGSIVAQPLTCMTCQCIRKGHTATTNRYKSLAMTARGMGNDTQHLPLSPRLSPPLTETREPSHTEQIYISTHAPSRLLPAGLCINTTHAHKDLSVILVFHPPFFTEG